jgi:cytochrome P450
MRVTVLYIITNPIVYQRLQAEIKEAEQNGHITRPIIRDSETRNLPYLQACIKEGLRICPPASGLLMKQVPPKGDIISGYFVPGGTRIGWSAWSLQRNKDIYGKDVDLFRPERWLEASDKRLKQMERTVDLVFASGKWTCLGRPIALMELNKVLFEVSALSLYPPKKREKSKKEKGSSESIVDTIRHLL